jgi:hypothetical protein
MDNILQQVRELNGAIHFKMKNGIELHKKSDRLFGRFSKKEVNLIA